MTMSDSEDGTDDDDSVVATQTERDILQTLKDKYGSLTRESFNDAVTKGCSQVDIDEFSYKLILVGLN
jgi:hypothetical protein